jgi:hypothetical protein
MGGILLTLESQLHSTSASFLFVPPLSSRASSHTAAPEGASDGAPSAEGARAGALYA